MGTVGISERSGMGSVFFGSIRAPTTCNLLKGKGNYEIKQERRY